MKSATAWIAAAVTFGVTFATGRFALGLGWLGAAAAAAPFAIVTYLALAMAPLTRVWSTSAQIWLFATLGIGSVLLGLWFLVTPGTGVQGFVAWIPVANAVLFFGTAILLGRRRGNAGPG